MIILIASNKPEIFDFETAKQIVKHGYSYYNIVFANEFFDHRGRIDWKLLESKYSQYIGISCYYTGKVPADHVNWDNGRCWVNIHPGILPEMRGRNLCYWAIKKGCKRHGVTAHWMDKDYDTGNIIDTKTFPISDWMNAGDLSRINDELANQLFLDILERIVNNGLPDGQPQNGGEYHTLEPIDDFIELDEFQQRAIRAICTSLYVPKALICGREYTIQPTDQIK